MTERGLVRCLWVCLALAFSVAGASDPLAAGGRLHEALAPRSSPVPFVFSGFDPLGSDAPSDTVRVLVPASADRHNQNKLIGGSLFGSGLFLCSWGITSWQTSESQCCPPRNTQNILKIVVGIVLIDAGLVYLLGGFD